MMEVDRKVALAVLVNAIFALEPEATVMSDATRNLVWSGSAGTLVQAGTVTGGLHLHHAPGWRRPIPRQLPIPPRWLVGRDRELRRLTAAFDRGAAARELTVLTVEGAGGVGKTALALFWAHQNVRRFPDGQLFADLKGFDNVGTPAGTASVLNAFLITLGIDPDAIPTNFQATTALYRSFLAGKRMILLLDNAYDSAQVLPLLPGDPSCGVIVTSRRQLPGLHRYGASRVLLDSLPAPDAHVFLARAVGDSAGVEETAIDALVDCCAGLPLALEIVAARVSSHPDFPLSALARELEQESAGLDAFDAGDDLTNLRAVLSWSAAGLDDGHTRMFRLLALAQMPEIGIAPAASLAALSVSHTTRLMRALEMRNLVRQYRPGRFQLHDLVRRHAAELSQRVDPAPERSAALQRLVDFYLHTALAADRLLYPHRTPTPTPELADSCRPLEPADELAALDWFAQEHQQILAVQQLAARQGWLEQVWQLARALDTYHYRRSHIQANVDSSRLGAEAADRIGDVTVRALAHRQLGRAYTRSGQLAEADAALRLVLSLTKQTDDVVGQAHTLHDLSRVCSSAGLNKQALSNSVAAMALYRAAGNSVGEAHTLGAQGRQLAVLGDHEGARECCMLALSLHEGHGNASGQLAALETLGFVTTQTGHHAAAARYYSQALGLCQSQRNSFAEAQVLEHLAGTHIAQGEMREALAALLQARDLYASQHRAAELERVRLTLDGVERGISA